LTVEQQKGDVHKIGIRSNHRPAKLPEESTRPDIAYTNNQCARFTNDLRELHKQAMLRIGRYLLATSE